MNRQLLDLPDETSASDFRLALKQDLDRMWRLRDDGNGKRATELYLQILQKYGFSFKESIAKKWDLLSKEDLPMRLDLLLFEVAYWRGKMDLARSNEILRALEELIAQKDGVRTTRFYLQSGLNHYCESQYGAAIALFSEGRELCGAKTQAEDDCDLRLYLIFELNIILSMEMLGYDYRPRLSEFFKRFEDLRRKRSRDLIGIEGCDDLQNSIGYESLRDQWGALHIRDCLSRSDFSGIEKMFTQEDLSSQSLYVLLWLSKLPYFQFKEASSLKGRLLNQELREGSRWLSEFRLRSFEGRLVADDLRPEIKLEVKIERLYLWIWDWLAQPHPTLLRRIFDLLSHILERVIEQPMDHFAYQLLENGTRWLALLARLPAETTDSLFGRASFALGEATPFLRFERDFQGALFALRSRQNSIVCDTLSALILTGSQESSHYFLLAGLARELLDPLEWNRTEKEGLPKGLIEKRFSSLRTLFSEWNVDSEKIFEEGLVIDKGRQRVHLLGRSIQREIESTVLSQLLAFACLNPDTTRAEVLSFVFGISEYDEVYHSPKISNLLSKANRVLGEFGHFKSNRESVIFEIKVPWKVLGSTVYDVQIEPYKKRLLRWSMDSRDYGETQGFGRPKTRFQAKSSHWDRLSGWFERNDLEKALGVSKATAVRKIAEWKTQKSLEQKRRGKSVSYKLSSSKLESLKKEAICNEFLK